MGVSLGLNYTANLIVLDLFLLAILVSFAFAFSTPFFGNVPIVYSSDPVVRMVFMICYVGSFSSYCCLGSVLFHKAATCVMFTCFLFIISVYLDMNWNPPPFLDRALLIFSVAGTQKGITALINLEKTVDGIHWSNINLELTTEDNHIICVMREMRILLISIPLQLIAAALVILFSSRLKTAEIRFRKRLWGRRSVIGQVEQNMAHYEAHHEEGEACAVFEHLHTDGADGRATLRDINWTIQKGEVSIALGLENSGRLAILAVIYGDTTPIYGTASVFGLDLMKHPTKIIRDCGVSNRGATGLFMNLTVRDNFRVFSKIRHCCQQRVRHNRDSLINDAGLKSLLDTQVWKLREEDRVALKVALAFLGDSLLVILEDPTKDQEIHTKMRLWNLIKNHSKGRTVLISTMCMTEAQMIGDRITIFMDGQIHCSGSVRYIKSFFGTGYYLDIVKKRRADSKNISLICREYCPDCVLVEETNKRSMFLLPCTSDMGNVEDLLDFLEANQAKLQIASYDLQGSRLENAFVNLTTAFVYI
ncbi:hypothetical protein EGW08_003716 [Elysia chlorotica]|uniref:ABC transporter domain-containing protein n=1 Tax=Elysia chlorotica TaxID=188477 RepID=A0A3S1BTV5_ELYCH|nr:hypothetical protein EGW08_003716 [Elysia chlorotica]